MPYFTVQGPRQFPSGDIITGLTHRWPMDDANVTTTVNDTIGTDHGTIFGPVTSAAGPPGGLATARALDGVDGTVIQLASSPAQSSTWNAASFSIAGWLFVIANNVLTTFYDSINVLTTDFVRGLMAGSLGTGQVGFSTSGVGLTTSSLVIANSTWVHFVYTNAGGGSGGTQAIFVNGSSAATTANTVGDGGGGATTHCLGAIYNGIGAQGLNGRLSSWRVYSRALSAADANALYVAGG